MYEDRAHISAHDASTPKVEATDYNRFYGQFDENFPGRSTLVWAQRRAGAVLDALVIGENG